MRTLLALVIVIAGVASILIGVWLFWPPLVLILAGLAAIGCGGLLIDTSGNR